MRDCRCPAIGKGGMVRAEESFRHRAALQIVPGRGQDIPPGRWELAGITYYSVITRVYKIAISRA